MIRKTITITSLAILVAAISVATTMTMVQADVDGDTVIFTVSPNAAPSPDAIVVINPGIEYFGELVSATHPITANIDGDPDNEVWILLSNGSPVVGDVVVEISDIQWFSGGTGAIGSFSCATDTGTATSAGLFNKDTLEITITFSVIDEETEVHCDFEDFHGDITKVDSTPNCGPIGIKETFSTPCSFTITYTGDLAIIRDTVPAEWRVDDITNSGETRSADQANKGKKANKSATKIECVDVTSVDTLVEAETRTSPSGKNKFKPTECGEFFLNNGAFAFLSDGSGNIVIGTLDDEPIVLDSTDDIPVLADDSGPFFCNGEAKPT